jgi:flagellar assembly factor FliW
MKVRTRPYGEIEIEDRQRISFPRGIFGFEQLREFILLDATTPPFYWLQSAERVEVAFVLIDPKFFCPDYTPDVETAELEEIGITHPDDMLVFAIVTIPQSAHKMTANLQGPLILNRRTQVGRQSISSNPRWGVRHTIMDELAQSRQNPPGTSARNPPGTSAQNPPGTSARKGA